jgi:hypothetical protein
MRYADIPFHPSRRTLRQFAAIWLLLFLALGYKHFFKEGHHTSGIVLSCLAMLVGIPGLLQPSLVRWVFIGSIVLTFPIGWLVSQLLLGVLFFLVITPAALFFRLRGRDLLGRTPAKDRATFWTKKNMPQDVRSYFRQF